MNQRLAPIALVAGLLLAVTSAPAAADGSIDCELRFDLSGWSAFYKTGKGSGTVSCDNGQSMAVQISTKGGGLTFGKTQIEDGRGEFSGIHSIDDVLGTLSAPRRTPAPASRARPRS